MENVICTILEKLSLFHLEQHIDEVISNTYSAKFAPVRHNKGVSDWKVEDVLAWIKQLKMLQEDVSNIAEVFTREFIDGYTLMTLTEDDWINTLKLRHETYFLLQIIIQEWQFGNIEHSFVPSNTPLGIQILYKLYYCYCLIFS
jgi:hypothetical protein